MNSLFSPKDWKCPACCNINWQKREACNQCNAPKPGMIGDREGRAGGFKERDDVVEYRSSRFDTTEDQYDDFGRVRKKSTKIPSKPIATTPAIEVDDFGRIKKTVDVVKQDDDDDDEDDGRWAALEGIIEGKSLDGLKDSAASSRSPSDDRRSSHTGDDRRSRDRYDDRKSHRKDYRRDDKRDDRRNDRYRRSDDRRRSQSPRRR
ncbi:hypothetical protein BDV3_004698 [Batrachochytrium dendrobatidis]|uniref:RanBP2-type domain-containing protein n=1 Tax=Batrachochytrium dendrobatidis (strain JEL423) TaxID=403673 RepID=A0A177WKZ3_BATDL|nr:TATA-binding protein-associated factor 2N [Batrachochytrium dendrobatidis]KAK5671190.1 TATA-binding protein-associated factor 2N, variant 2 [Batrachochytrium dendrobatidis]OAJ40130.1 hypothetical protein BDEG_23897 [Batrachochytrium dendrobatidis JEL423]